MSTKNSCTGGKKTITRRKGGMMGTAREIREFGQLPQAEQINAIYQKIIDCPALNKNNMFTPADEEGDKLFNIFNVNELDLFFITKGVILLVCKFIYKEIFIGNDIRSYNKYLCRLKVISFTA